MYYINTCGLKGSETIIRGGGKMPGGYIIFLCGGHFNKNKADDKVGVWMRNHPNNVRQTMTCDAPGCKACLSRNSPSNHYMWVLYRHDGKHYPNEYSHTHPGWLPVNHSHRPKPKS